MKAMKLFSRKGGAKLGQHFLTSARIAQTIARESGAAPGATVLEVGPGKGMLTKELLALGASVVAVEKDPDMVAACTNAFPEAIASGKLRIIEGDARELLTNGFNRLELPEQYTVAANIPYYITGELIRLFLTAPQQPTIVVVLIQKEVAERIARTKKESILSLSVKAYGNPVYVQTVKAGSFNPPPKVDSAVLKIEHISRENFVSIDEGKFFDLLHAGFGQKRKVLLGNLKRAYGDSMQYAWDELSLDTNIRAEDVSLAIWLQLTEKT